MDKRIHCPSCGQEGVLQWKETVTKAKGRTYRYKKLYVYHWNPEKPRWCYLNKEQLKQLEDRGILNDNLTQNTPRQENLNSRISHQIEPENSRAGSLARLGHLLDVQKVAGSNPARPTNRDYCSAHAASSFSLQNGDQP